MVSTEPVEVSSINIIANALEAFGQSGQFNESDWLSSLSVDQNLKFQGNSVLRGGQQPVTGTDPKIIR